MPNSLYGHRFNKVAREVDVALAALRGARVCDTGLGDQNVASSDHGGLQEDFAAWQAQLLVDLAALREGRAKAQVFSYESTDEEEAGSEGEDVIDIEALGGAAKGIKAAKEGRAAEVAEQGAGEAREMVTPSLRKALTKQG